MKNIASLKSVSFQRSGQVILENINWSIKPGEQWGVLGLNGSGKTSLLNIISGYHFPSTGEVEVLGNVFGKTNLPELRKKIGFVSSSLERFTSYYSNETVERVIVSGKFASFGIYEEVKSEDWERADSLLVSLRLLNLKGKVFHQLSEGEKRRVLIARSLMSKPSILILDEPCSGLDILSREEFLDSMNAIVKSGCHIIYVTHHIEELVNQITHVLLLKDGKIVSLGKKAEVLQEDLLSETFRVPVAIRWEDNRPGLTIKKR
ncbi:ABC transporter ATP-binding protein [Sporosarcina sp. CAU 1771]